MTQAEVQPVLDNPITRVEPNAKAYKIPVAPNGSCTYHAGLEAAVVALSKQSAAKGSSDWKIAEATWFSSAQYHSEVVPAGQLGDRALWSENPKGAGGGYAVSKYPYLVNVVIAGKLPRSPEDYTAKLRQLTALVLSRLR